jgi:chaperone BCS1
MSNSKVTVVIVFIALFALLTGFSWFLLRIATTSNTLATALNSSTSTNDEQSPSLLSRFLQQNKLFLITGIIGIATSLLTSAYWLCKEIFNYVTRHFVTTVSLNNADEAFAWLMTYLGNQHTLYHQKLKQKSSTSNRGSEFDEFRENEKLEAVFITAPSLIASVERIKKKRWYQTASFDDGNAVNVQYVPEDGFHMFKFRGKLFWFDKQKGQDSVNAGASRQSQFTLETCELRMLGSINSKENQQLLMDLFYEAMQSTLSNHTDVLRIYTTRQWGGWQLALAKTKRPFQSVILDKNMAENLLQDATNFLKRKDWYSQKGIPFRRGYLLYGLPGTGKSSFVSALASKLNLNICVLDLSSGIIGDEELAQRMQSAPANSVILLEDIDAIFVNRDTPDEKKQTRKVTFAGLLNAIDGIAAPESGRLLFMTTNHIEKLDPALIRAGRCDVKVEFTYATRDQVRVAFKHFYPSSTDEQAKRFCNALEGEGEQLTMAQILNHLSRFKDQPEQSIENIADGFIKRIRQFAVEERNSSSLPIDQWLKRLGLAKYSDSFKKEKIRHILDMGDGVGPADFANTFKISAAKDQQRIADMLNADKDIVAEFQTITSAELKRILASTFVAAPQDFIIKFVKRIAQEDVSFLEVKAYLNEFTYQYYNSRSEKERQIVLDQILSNVDTMLLNPPSYYLTVPDAKDLVNIHDGKQCVEISNKTDLNDYCLKVEDNSAVEWIKQLNKEYKWWTPAPQTKKTEDKKQQPPQPEKTSSPQDGTDNDKKSDEELPESLETVLDKMKNENVETIRDLLALGADKESTWESKFNVKKKGRRLKIARALTAIKTKVDDFDKIKTEWSELYSL